MNLESIENKHFSKPTKSFNRLKNLAEAIDKRSLSLNEWESIKNQIKEINAFQGSKRDFKKLVKKSYMQMLTYLEDSLNLVAKNHYQVQWMMYGIFAGGILSALSFNIEFLGFPTNAGILMSFGLIGGILIGSEKDKQAQKEGRQLDFKTSEF